MDGDRTTEQLAGVFVPTILPLTSGRGPDLRSYRRHIGYLCEAGVHGLWVNGTTGEYNALTDAQQVQVVEAAVQCVQKRIPVIAHAGDTGTQRAIRRAQAALQAGADHVSLILPYYVDFSEPELIRHLQLVADALGQPVLLYSNPAICRVTLSVDAIADLADEGVVVGVKESSLTLSRYAALLEAAAGVRKPLRCFLGAAELAQTGLTMGGHGIMCAISNIAPHVCVRLYDCIHANRHPEGQALQDQLDRLREALVKALRNRPHGGAMVAAYKWILREMDIIEHAIVLDPLEPLTKNEQDILAREVLPLACSHRDAEARQPASDVANETSPILLPETRRGRQRTESER